MRQKAVGNRCGGRHFGESAKHSYASMSNFGRAPPGINLPEPDSLIAPTSASTSSVVQQDDVPGDAVKLREHGIL